MTDFDTAGQLDIDVGQFVDGMEEAGDASSDFADNVEEGENSLLNLSNVKFGAISAGIGAAGIAGSMVALTDNTQELRESLERTAVTMEDTSAESLQDLTTDLTDASLSAEEASTFMSGLAEAGVETEEEMRDLVPALDDIADATGASADEVSDLAGTVKSMDGDFDAVAEDADAFVAAANETQVELSDVQSTMERLDFEEMEEMGVAADDAAGLIAKFGDETGFSGRQLRSNFNEALEETDGDMDDLIDNLGLSAEEFEEFQEETASGTELTEEYAEAANSTLSPVDELRAEFDDLKLELSSMAMDGLEVAAEATLFVIEGFETLADEASPVISFVTDLTGGLDGLSGNVDSTGRSLENASRAANRLAAPIRDELEPVASEVGQTMVVWGDAAQDVADIAGGRLEPVVDSVAETLDDPVRPVAEDVADLFGDGVVFAFEQTTDAAEGVAKLLRGDFSGAFEIAEGIATDTKDAIVGNVEDLPGDVKVIITDDLPPAIRDGVGAVGDAAGDVGGAFFSGIRSGLGDVADIGEGILEDIGDGITDAPGVMTDAIGSVLPENIPLPSVEAGDLASFNVEAFGQSVGVDLPPSSVDLGSIPLPSLDTGGLLGSDGPIMAHAGERVLPDQQVSDRGEASFDPSSVADGFDKSTRAQEMVHELSAIKTGLVRLAKEIDPITADELESRLEREAREAQNRRLRR